MFAQILLQHTGNNIGLFDYAVAEDMSEIQAGDLVEVPFRKTTVNGIVWSINEEPNTTAEVKEILNILPYSIPRQQRILADWISKYYYAPLAKTVELFLPQRLWDDNFDASRYTETVVSLNSEIPVKKKMETTVRDFMLKQKEISYTELRKAISTCTPKVFEKLIESGLLKVQSTKLKDPVSEPDNKHRPLSSSQLTNDQKTAFTQITSAKSRETFLLFGPPASGKTETYLQLAQHYEKIGKQIVVIVPELALSTQLVHYFTGTFGQKISVIHSHLTENEVALEWLRIEKGQARIILGSRLALFQPFQDLGCIIVDEEHEWTYKNEQTPRYHARDVAIELGKIANCPVVLGSATPSIESYTYAKLGKYQLLKLQKLDIEKSA